MGDWARLLGQAVEARQLAVALTPGVPLRDHTTFRIGGPAGMLVQADSVEELRKLLAFARASRVAVKTIGGGSNLLVSDQGFPGIVLRLGGAFRELESSGVEVKVGAAVRWGELLELTQSRGLAGAEFLCGIPGTLGGGIRTNAGAFGHELSELVTGIEVMTPDGRVRRLERGDVQFGYRRCGLGGDTVILSAGLRLENGTSEVIAARIRENRSKRSASQPKGASAGSVFRNPKGESAGSLIDRTGLKGRHVGDAVVSEKHANFIINQGRACCRDVLQLIEVIKLKVEEKFSIILEEEIEVVGALDVSQ